MDLVATSLEFARSGRKTFCQSSNEMYYLRNVLEKKDFVKGECIVLTRTKVPIIKFTDSKTNIKVDISFENNSGLNTLPTLRQWKTQYPQMPVLVAVIKQFLAMRGLNEVHSGGIGGFTIICLVVSMLQLKPELQGKLQNVGYGDLLLDFFDLYGNKFDHRATGIQMKPPGYFQKSKNVMRRMQANINPERLTIIDPNVPSNDISGGSAKIDAVFDCFRGAHSVIQRELQQVRNGDSRSRSILGCILGGNYESFEDQRDLLYRVNQESMVSATPSPPPAAKDPWFERDLPTQKGPPPAVKKRIPEVKIPHGDLCQAVGSNALKG